MVAHEISAVTDAKPGLISFDDAAALISKEARALGTECIPLEHADGRILANPAIARRSSPPALVSAMDGYAVRDADVAHGSVSLKIAGKSFAGGNFNQPLLPGTCVRIFTGALAPAGTDRVIMQEDVRENEGFAMIADAVTGRRHLRRPGSDFAEGDVIVPARCRLTPQHLVGIAAADIAAVEVFSKPKVAILCCGDELTEPGKPNRPAGSIPESISFGVSALIRRWGGQIVTRLRCRDDLGLLQNVATDLAAIADVVIIIGGASVGERDFAKLAFAPLGLELAFSKVAIKPGKPVWFGRAGKTLVVGLPGNPSSALVTARLLVVPLIAGLSGGRSNEALDFQMMRTSVAIECCPDRDVFARATLRGRLAIPLSDQDSASQKALAAATHLIRRRQTAAPGAETLVETLVL